MPDADIAIIGGSGLYHLEGLEDVEEADIVTPFGAPSDIITIGTIQGRRVAFLPRHGRRHRISPSELPALANIYALKSLGVERVIAVSAVGSLREDIHPLDIVIPDQLIDHTSNRNNTFFTNGAVAHIALAEPFCPELRHALEQAARRANANFHNGGTCLVMEGPQFSTRAESHMYREWGADIIVMTTLPEAKLAREAEMCYIMLALVTDYDCWHPQYKSVTADIVLATLEKGITAAENILQLAIPLIPEEQNCSCPSVLQDALVTAPQDIPLETREQLHLLLEKYLDGGNNV